MCDGKCFDCGCCGDVVGMSPTSSPQKTYFVDFSGYCEIKADNAQQAETEFWRRIQENLPLPSNVYEVDCVEEKVSEWETVGE